MWFALLMACSLHATRTGRVVGPGHPVAIDLREGGTAHLRLRDGDEAVAWLYGVELQVAGPRLGRTVWVREWTVGPTDSGSTPFVGRLHRFGSNWLLEDRGSGGTYQIEEESLGALSAHDGHMVMVEGFVVGAHIVRVVSWRALYDAPAGVAAGN